jgi:hypothetical protein
MKLELIQGMKGEKERLEVVDVTAVAEKMSMAVPGWRVQLTQQVWDRYVGEETDCQSGDSTGSRLRDLCCYLWVGLRFAEHPAGWVLGGFDIPIGELFRDVDTLSERPGPWRLPVEVRLTVISVIARNGSPALLVLQPHDHFDYGLARSEL